MNRENVEYCINIMKNATNLDMRQWYSDINTRSIDDLHTCGNKACFIGYIGLSKKFKEDGGYINRWGFPTFKYDNEYYEGHIALAKWLGIHDALAHEFAFGCKPSEYCDMYDGGTSDYDPDYDVDYTRIYSPFYNKLWIMVTSDDVIIKLNKLLTGELA